jgi:3-hydroxy-9,10-secoandrosta-1,3,5(10)-triene-9,17-dione monooxygenase
MSVRAPETLDADALVARAAAMRDTLRSRQAQCEAEGRLPDATSEEYVAAGLFRVLQPRRFGGYELGLEAFLRIAIELSRGCPSSGWVYALTAGHAHTVAMWPEQAQTDLFGDGHFICPFSNLPARAVRVDGGYRIDGWWDYGTGCDIGTHFIGGVAVASADGGPPGDTRWAAFPRSAYRIVDNWDTLGMRGTGSRRVVVEDLFVPDHHTVASPNPERLVVDFPGREVHENPIYRGGAIMPLLVSEPAAVAVGIAQGAIDHYVELLQTRRQYGPASPLRRNVAMFQRDLGQATALADTAEAALMQVAATWTAQAHEAAETGVQTSDEAQRRLLMICQQIVEMATATVDVVLRTAGTSATRKGEAVERCFRDVNMIRTHVTMQFDRTFENVGRMRLGLPPGGFF